MKNKRRIAAVCLAAMLLATLTGCQLAREDKGTDACEDRLAGVLVTMEYLDLFDMEGYLNDNIGSFPGGEIAIDGSTNEYQGRLYATLQKKALTDEETGKTTEIEQYAFEGVDGMPYFVVRMHDSSERGSYLTTGSDEAISDGHTSINMGDNENSLSLEGTIFVSPIGHCTYYLNPVYQSADGSVYATSGSGFSIDGGHPEGAVYSQTMKEDHAVTEDGKAVKYSTSIKFSIHVMNPPARIVVLQMDGGSAAVSRQEFAPGKLPKTITPELGVAYIIVETTKTDGDGKPQITRTLYGKDTEILETFFCREDGICVKQWTQLDWEE